MITGFMGISYSTDEIKNGKFVDRTLESDFLQTRYDILRQPGRRFMVDESVWRRNGEEARKHFLRMMEESNKKDLMVFKESIEDEEEAVLQTDTFTYTGTEKPPKEVKTLIITPEVREIPDGEFKDMAELVSIVFPDGATDLKIGKNAFENCPKLTSIRLNGTTFIGDEAFLNCTGLVAVELGAACQHVGMGAFKNCTVLSTVTIPPNVTFMGDYAFANCAELKTVTVMDGVVEIPAYTFQNCPKLEQIILPATIEKVAETAFENCPNIEVYVPTLDMKEAEEILNTKMTQKAEEDDTLFKCRAGYIVRLYKDLY